MKRAVALLLFCALCLLCGCSAPSYFVEFSLSQNVYSQGEKLSKSEIARLQEDISALLHEIESQVSTETEGSDIDRINAAKAGEKVYVGEHTAAMLEICGQLYKQTGGAFSPALYNLSRLWGFTPEFEGMYTVPRAEPSSQEIAEALSVSSFDDVRIEGNVVVKEKDDVRLDLGGIAKGYMSDCVRALIAERYPDFSGTFSVMSNSVLMGQKQEDAAGLGYTATLENPRADVTGGVSANGALYFTGLSDVAVSTSADNIAFTFTTALCTSTSSILLRESLRKTGSSASRCLCRSRRRMRAHWRTPIPRRGFVCRSHRRWSFIVRFGKSWASAPWSSRPIFVMTSWAGIRCCNPRNMPRLPGPNWKTASKTSFLCGKGRLRTKLFPVRKKGSTFPCFHKSDL